MTMEKITLNVPSTLYNQIKRRADRAHRTVAAELIDAVTAAVPLTDELPRELADAVASLAQLDDETLQRAAQSHFASDKAEQLEALHFKRQESGLTADESRRAAELTQEYERAMLIRAQATALLLQRGHDVADLVTAVSE